jgi:hypothetical protein
LVPQKRYDTVVAVLAAVCLLDDLDLIGHNLGETTPLGQRFSCLMLEVPELVDTAAELLLRTELGCEECFDDVTRDLRTNDPRTYAQHIHVVVLDRLARHESVVADCRANTGNLVGGNAGARTGTADKDDTLDFAFLYQGNRPARDIREVDRRVRHRTYVNNFVTVLLENFGDEVFQQEACVVIGEPDGRPLRNCDLVG